MDRLSMSPGIADGWGCPRRLRRTYGSSDEFMTSLLGFLQADRDADEITNDLYITDGMRIVKFLNIGSRKSNLSPASSLQCQLILPIPVPTF